MTTLGKTTWTGVLGCFWALTALAQSGIPNDVPLRPDPNLTPGGLCDTGKTVRYPEKIRYCERDVDSYLKDAVFFKYQQKYGMKKYSRHQFKLDHYIPLCMGGSNNAENLWPQHTSISTYTDPLEALLCKGMSLGKIRQAAAIQLIQRAKADLSITARMRLELQQAYGP